MICNTISTECGIDCEEFSTGKCGRINSNVMIATLAFADIENTKLLCSLYGFDYESLLIENKIKIVEEYEL
jgi:hypothetical protein